MSKESLIVTIVRKGFGDTVLQASLKSGAEGGTLLYGRGCGVHEKGKILGIPIEPEKEIVLTVTYSNKTEEILRGILSVTDLCKPGMGIAFVIPLEKVVGVTHLTRETPQ